MAGSKENINAAFAPQGPEIPEDIMGVLESMLRLHSISAQDLYYKWETYCMTMGDETSLDLGTARMFQKSVQDTVERGHHGKAGGRGSERKPVVIATPRVASNGDVFGMLDELTPNTLPRRSGGTKRKAETETPHPRKVSKPDMINGGTPSLDGIRSVPFSDRQNEGEIVNQLNGHLQSAEPPIAPFPESRIRLVANTDIKKFAYKPMSMRLSESSEVLDERIDEFLALVQKHYELEDSAFGNPASQSTSDIVAVGRIATDMLEGKLNTASLVLETSRRTGAGLRVPLRIEALSSHQFFPGQIVALKGINASGNYFTVTEGLPLPPLPMPVSPPNAIASFNEKLDGMPLSVMLASGPYTSDDNLAFEPLQALCEKAKDNMVDAMILTGPFLDIEHPLLATGDFELSSVKAADQETTMTTCFRLWISKHLQQVCSVNPSITVILVPSVRDLISKHVSWPQEQLSKKDLGLPKQVRMLPNPCFLSFNEMVVAVSTQDILYELSREQISGGKIGGDLMTRLPRHLIDQRHFYPLFPPTARESLPKGSVKPTGACLDVGYLKLAEWMTVKPDILLTPSTLTPTVKVVDSVMVVNPGYLAKRKAPGTFAQLTLHPRVLVDEEQEQNNVPHNIFERGRLDVIRI